MHIDIWSPLTVLHKNQEGCRLINDMCDLTQFVILSIKTDTKAESLAKLFMEEVVLSFGMVALVLVDADRRFRGAFEEMFKCLQITFWNLARGNHRINSVEKYHRFFKKHNLSQDKIVGAMVYLSKTQKHLSIHGTAPQLIILM